MERREDAMESFKRGALKRNCLWKQGRFWLGDLIGADEAYAAPPCFRCDFAFTLSTQGEAIQLVENQHAGGRPRPGALRVL